MGEIYKSEQVELQENGIIRNQEGTVIGRLITDDDKNVPKYILKEKEEMLRIFASMHLVCIEKYETYNEKRSRFLLERYGYIEYMRKKLGGKYKEPSSQEFIDSLGK